MNKISKCDRYSIRYNKYIFYYILYILYLLSFSIYKYSNSKGILNRSYWTLITFINKFVYLYRFHLNYMSILIQVDHPSIIKYINIYTPCICIFGIILLTTNCSEFFFVLSKGAFKHIYSWLIYILYIWQFQMIFEQSKSTPSSIIIYILTSCIVLFLVNYIIIFVVSDYWAISRYNLSYFMRYLFLKVNVIYQCLDFESFDIFTKLLFFLKNLVKFGFKIQLSLSSTCLFQQWKALAQQYSSWHWFKNMC